MSTKTRGAKSAPEVPRPSASIILVSPSNQVLLLHRVVTSSAFPSAHVFPGGNLSLSQDGLVPPPEDPRRHEDGPAYRMAAIRECFEESGILLARQKNGGALLEVGEEQREQARKGVHGNTVRFQDWVTERGGVADVENLIPFTRWITPIHIPRRFTTQMYLYFLPLAMSGRASTTTTSHLPAARDTIIPAPTSDGGIEHTTASFLPPGTWLSQARAGEIILFPPQVYLLHLLSPFFSPSKILNTLSPDELQQQRERFIDFLRRADPPYEEMCISPQTLRGKREDGRLVLAVDSPGPELRGSGRKGDREKVVLVRFGKEGPREVEIVSKDDVSSKERKEKTGERL
ncbi:MAG: hypothetical protein M1817_003367 [Caeruleum heppii]|nr:MAG: hypothetical protein M1817_003367 [Caeruleum heppii]